MSFLGPSDDPDVELDVFSLYRERIGFVPSFLRAQSILPRLVEAEAELARSILLRPAGLTQIQKEYLTLAVDAHLRCTYAVTAHARILSGLGVPSSTVLRLIRNHREAGLAPEDVALVDFGVKLAMHPTWLERGEFTSLRGIGFTDEQILEAVLTVAIARFMCTLSMGLGAEPDFEAIEPNPDGATEPRVGGPSPAALDEDRRGYLRPRTLDEGTTVALEFFKERYGFVPRFYRQQSFRPDIVAAEAKLLDAVVMPSEALSRTQKEMILVAVAAAGLNSYFVAVGCAVLTGLGVPLEIADQIAVDHHGAGLADDDIALLDTVLVLARSPGEFTKEHVLDLRRRGFSDAQIVEALCTAALGQFLSTIQTGLGTTPDFPIRFEFPREAPAVPTFEKKNFESVNPAAAPAHPIVGGVDDPDAGDVARVRAGDVDAFEGIVRRHGGRLLRALAGITGSPADAEDALQNAFIKAFERLDEFQGGSRFGTWLTRVAINEGLQRIRSRKPTESLDESRDADDEFRPRLILPWHENPESLYAEDQRRELVQAAVSALPEKYRVVVVLRDMEEMSTEEAAQALGLPVPTMKTRLLRGRLLLREALAPHFVARLQSRRP